MVLDVGRFLAGIGALVWNQDNSTYLVLKRSPDKDFAPEAWECITGRVDQGESFEEALRREVREETGLEVRPIYLLGTTHFFRGTPVPENELLGLVYLCEPVGKLIPGRSIVTSLEHSEYRWVSVNEARELLSLDNQTELWLARVINRAEIIREHLPESLLNTTRSEGFELDS
jgi:8-oxo-dGTP diphosphatase